MPTRVKRESLEIDEAEPGRIARLFTLHDASLEAQVDAAPQKVKPSLLAAVQSVVTPTGLEPVFSP